MVNVNKIRILAKEKGLSLTFICNKLDLANSYFNDVQKNHRDIPDDRLQIIADILGTTPEYLRDETDTKEKPINTAPAISETVRLTAEEAELIELFRSLPLRERGRFIVYGYDLKDEADEKTKSPAPAESYPLPSETVNYAVSN